MNLKLLLVVTLFSTFASAQQASIDMGEIRSLTFHPPEDSVTAPSGPWKKGGLFNLNLAQTSLNNWAAGGDKFSLSLNTMLSVHALYKKDKNSWDNTLDVNFGYLKSTSLGSRKNDDRFDLLSKYGHALAPKWNASFLFNFRTQLANGYSYSGTQKTFTSAFLAPAYLTAGLGFDFRPDDHFSVFISPFTARWVIVKDDSLSAKGMYGVEPGKKIRTELGALVSANYLKDLSKSVSYKGRLDLFSNYRHHPGKIDVYFTNLLAVKLSRVLSATWNLDLIYDDDVRMFGSDGKSPAWQLKSLTGIGLMFKF